MKKDILPKGERQKITKSYMKYSGIGFQMALTIALGIVIGLYLDKRMNFDQNYMTALMSLIFTGIAMYNVIKVSSK